MPLQTVVLGDTVCDKASRAARQAALRPGPTADMYGNRMVSRKFTSELLVAPARSVWLPHRWRPGILARAGASIGDGVVILGSLEVTVPSHIELGDGVLVNRNCYLESGARIQVRAGAGLGDFCRIITSTHEVGAPTKRYGLEERHPVVIGEGAWLGANCLVLPGVTVGAGAIVAAGSVVNRDVAPNTLVAGVPATYRKDVVSSMDQPTIP